MALTKVSTGLISADLASVDLNIDANTLYIDVTNNRVGINNIGPATALDVTGTVTADGLTVDGSTVLQSASGVGNTVHMRGGDYTSTSFATGIKFEQPSGTLNANRQFRFTSGSSSLTIQGTDGSGTDVSDAKLVINPNGGNVGIGTASPVTSLTLGSGTTGVSFKSADASINSGKIAVIKPVEVGSGNGHLVFETYEGGSGGGERLRIDSAGNVGIGTSSPNTPLQVSGANSSTNADALFSVQKTTEGYGLFSGVLPSGVSWLQGGTSDDATYYNLALQPNGGSVGIGTDNPATTMHLSSTSTNIRLEDSDTNAYGQIGVDNAGSLYLQADNGNGQASSNMYMYVDGTERLRIDASGNLLVSKTGSDTLGTAGHELHNSGMAHHTRATGTVLYLNRTGDDGAIASFYKDGSTVGSIGTTLGSLYIQDDDTGLFFNRASNNILPIGNGTISDNSIDLGRGSARFKDLYLSGGVNQSTVLVSALPAAASSTGYRFMVSDSTVAASGNFGATVAGTGSNVVPVFSDGTNWLIG